MLHRSPAGPRRARLPILSLLTALLAAVLVSAPVAVPGGASSASAGTSDTTHLVKRGSDGAVWFKSRLNGAWGDWYTLHGGVVGEPAVTSWGPGRADVFARGTDDALWHRAYYDGRWNAWHRLGGSLSESPSAVTWGPGRLDVFVRGADGRLWQTAWAGDHWTAFFDLGGTLSSAPAAATWGPGRLDVFSRDAAMGLQQIAFIDGRWSGWYGLGGQLASAPAAVSWAPGRLDVFAQDPGDELVQIAFDGGRWSPWWRLGGGLSASPAVASPGPGRHEVYVRGGDDALWQRTYAAGWSGWERFSDGAGLSSGPDATSYRVQTADVRRVVSKGVEYTITVPPGKRGRAIHTALDELGSAYRYGSAGPDTFDCSGLVVHSYGSAGVSMPSRTSSGMYERLPKVASPQPGDLVYYGDPVHHMGIYLGDNLMVDASRSGDFVRIIDIHRIGSPPKYTTVPA